MQPASCRQEWVPPVTKEVCEQVCVQPESCREIPIPARYETVCEQIWSAPSKTEWRKVACEPNSLERGRAARRVLDALRDPARLRDPFEAGLRRARVVQAGDHPGAVRVADQDRDGTGGLLQDHRDPAPSTRPAAARRVVCPSRWEWRRTSECEVPGICPPPCPEYAPAPACRSDAQRPADMRVAPQNLPHRCRSRGQRCGPPARRRAPARRSVRPLNRTPRRELAGLAPGRTPRGVGLLRPRAPERAACAAVRTS